MKLRKLTSKDLYNFYQLASKEEIAKYMRFEAPKTVQEAQELLNEYLRGKSFAIIIENKFAGIFSFSPLEDKICSISIFLDKPYWNKGYATELIRKAKRFARESLGAKALAAYVVMDNEASKKILTKNGFYEWDRLFIPDLRCNLLIYRYNL